MFERLTIIFMKIKNNDLPIFFNFLKLQKKDVFGIRDVARKNFGRGKGPFLFFVGKFSKNSKKDKRVALLFFRTF